MSLALPAFVLFISLMQSLKEAQFLNITFLQTLFSFESAAAVFETVIASLTSMYALL